MKGLTELLALLTLTSVTAGRPARCPKTHSTDPIYLPDLKDSSAFWQCAHGVAYHMHCDAELVWNAELNVCDWPSTVEEEAEDSGYSNSETAAGRFDWHVTHKFISKEDFPKDVYSLRRVKDQSSNEDYSRRISTEKDNGDPDGERVRQYFNDDFLDRKLNFKPPPVQLRFFKTVHEKRRN